MADSCSQTVESSLDRVMYANRTSPADDSEDDSDSNSDCVSDLPPPPVFMGPATNSEPPKASRGRPRKDPPMLIPQVAKPAVPLNISPTEKPKHILIHGDKEVPISRVRTLSKTPLKGAKSCEVILLESDDSTVFSDEEDADEEEDENTVSP